jgi:hypothetical protein
LAPILVTPTTTVKTNLTIIKATLTTPTPSADQTAKTAIPIYNCWLCIVIGLVAVFVILACLM